LGKSFTINERTYLLQEGNFWKRIILEGIHRKKGKDLANLKSGYEIDKCWDPIIGSLDLEARKKKS